MFTSAWHLNSVYPKIKQQKLQHRMQGADLQMCSLVLLHELALRALSPVQGEQLWLTLGVVGLREKQGGSVVVPTLHGHSGFQGGC